MLVCHLGKVLSNDIVSLSEKSMLQQIMLEHHKFHATENGFFEEHCFQAIDIPESVLSINADGASSDLHLLPKEIGRVAKNTPEWPQKLQGVAVHGKAVFFLIFYTF